MNPSLRAPFLLICGMGSALSATVESTPSREIAVRFYNVADAPAQEIARAQQEASQIFERVGVVLRWLDCSGPAPDSDCSGARRPEVVSLRLLPPHIESPSGLPRGIFGFALMSAGDGFPTMATVYLGRVSAIADGRKYRRSVVLGAIMAHELGHLLLGANSHSARGLMALPWGPRLLTAADQGTLGFSKGEAARIRQDVELRLRNKQIALARSDERKALASSSSKQRLPLLRPRPLGDKSSQKSPAQQEEALVERQLGIGGERNHR